ncbi:MULTISPECIES: flagellar hook protein FlgE [Pseudomonas]|uniref:Flagellar hook protein FlgE n=1 Tax=Pseudomonas auratipiscis TaxID=3115853 RepID=A0AB35WTJ6_9PSED|nr:MULTISPECIES: flagellar hook protein FlgE [unclassified Pseudomonas]MEE1866421.1 flagellar hook protein FlgE [Pseudomonas sp. 120P]MEE1960164.1 flagellar hook protein FlgE [Pseudomonas sp. 119P]
MSFNIGLSGLYAANKALGVTGNNIANVATTGFKSSRAEFADQYSSSIRGTSSRTAVGSGVTTAAVSQMFTQGNFSGTGQSLDLAIDGNGFFAMSDNGSKIYTRAGAFYSDKAGYIVNAQGSNLQGYAVDGDGKVIKGVLTDLKIDTSNLAPNPTGRITETLNLNSSATAPKIAPFDPTEVGSYNYTFNTDVYDSQGNAHQMNQYFVKDAGTNSWTMYTTVDGRNPADPTLTTPLVNKLPFKSDGSLDTAAMTPGAVAGGLTITDTKTFQLSGWKPAEKNAAGNWVENGATAKVGGISLDMLATTQYNAASATTAKNQDGYATGELSGLTVDQSGNLFANFTNGQDKVIGQVAIANFANVQGLTPVGGTSWKESYASGVPIVGEPDSGTLGKIVGGSLEDSNVDLTGELVNLIKAQSNYQANAKTISTESTIMQTIIQMT